MNFCDFLKKTTPYEQVRATLTCRGSSNLLEPGRRPVRSWGLSQIPLRYLLADRSEAGRRPVADLLVCASLLLVIGQFPARCRSATSLEHVCDQDSVMEFGFNNRSGENNCSRQTIRRLSDENWAGP